MTTATDVDTLKMKIPPFIHVLREIKPEEETYKTQTYSSQGFKLPEVDRLHMVID